MPSVFVQTDMCRLDDFQKSTSLNDHTDVEHAVDRSQSPSVVSEASPNLVVVVVAAVVVVVVIAQQL